MWCWSSGVASNLLGVLIVRGLCAVCRECAPQAQITVLPKNPGQSIRKGERDGEVQYTWQQWGRTTYVSHKNGVVDDSLDHKLF